MEGVQHIFWNIEVNIFILSKIMTTHIIIIHDIHSIFRFKNLITAVGASAVEGVITGAVAGATGGTSLGTTVAANGVASAVGGVAKREINGQETTVSDVAIDAIAGGAGGAAANKAKGSVEKMVITNTVGKTVVEKGSVAGARGITKATVKEGGKTIKERSNSQSKGTAGTKSNGVKMDGGIQAANANRSPPAAARLASAYRVAPSHRPCQQ